jgi:hypothetical protein
MTGQLGYLPTLVFLVVPRIRLSLPLNSVIEVALGSEREQRLS